jgi:hypothetical protein
MNQRYFFMASLLNRLGQPDFFCRVIAVTLRVTAALMVLLALTIIFKVGKITFELAPTRVLGGILFEVFFILAVYAAVHVLLIRARDIELVSGIESYSISVLVLLLRLLGEAYCAFVGLLSIGGGLFVWFTNQSLVGVLGPLVRTLLPVIGDDSFMGGIEFMASGMLIGLGVLVLTYAAAQALALLVRPLRNGSHQTPTSDVSHGYRSRFGS